MIQPIHQAAWHGQLSELEHIVAADPRWLDAHVDGSALPPQTAHISGCTPLMLACASNEHAAVARLLHYRAALNAMGADKWTAAHWEPIGTQSTNEESKPYHTTNNKTTFLARIIINSFELRLFQLLEMAFAAP